MTKEEFIELWKDNMGPGDTANLILSLNEDVEVNDGVMTFEDHHKAAEIVADALGLE